MPFRWWPLLLVLGVAGCPPRRAPLPPRPLQGTFHTVAAGETVESLARRYRVDVSDVEEINGVDRRNALAAGRTLFIPRGTEPPKKRDGERISRKGGLPGGFFAWPVESGRLSSAFGPRGKSRHEGIDIAAPRGTPVLAAADGEVVYAGSGIRGYGKMVIVRHARKLVTVYAHNQRNLVQSGTRVRKGEVIAEVGSTGRATGPHLHFEVREGETPHDPLAYVSRPK